jgi:hypothetical protein
LILNKTYANMDLSEGIIGRQNGWWTLEWGNSPDPLTMVIDVAAKIVRNFREGHPQGGDSRPSSAGYENGSATACCADGEGDICKKAMLSIPFIRIAQFRY